MLTSTATSVTEGYDEQKRRIGVSIVFVDALVRRFAGMPYNAIDGYFGCYPPRHRDRHKEVKLQHVG